MKCEANMKAIETKKNEHNGTRNSLCTWRPMNSINRGNENENEN